MFGGGATRFRPRNLFGSVLLALTFLVQLFPVGLFAAAIHQGRTEERPDLESLSAAPSGPLRSDAHLNPSKSSASQTPVMSDNVLDTFVLPPSASGQPHSPSTSGQPNSPSGAGHPNYLTTLYQLITPHLHSARGTLSKGTKAGIIAFTIDNEGRVSSLRVSQSSGSPKIDADVREAIEKASPFPPPPRGAPLELEFRYGDN